MATQVLTKKLAGSQQVVSQPKRRIKPDTLIGYLFILPSIIGFSVFILYPMLFSAYIAFTKWNGLDKPVFNGLYNFIYMFTRDPLFWKSLQSTFTYVFLVVPATIIAGLLLAILLNRKLAGIQFFRTLFYIPAVLPIVASLTLWKYILEPRLGIANAVLTALHLPTSLWLGSQTAAIPSLVLINLWSSVGITMIIFLGALQAVPKEIYEAAELDGASKINSFVHMTLPMISPIILLQVILHMIGALQAFTQVHVLTKGAPNNVTNFLMYKIYINGFGTLSSAPDLGYATAEVWILFIIIAAITILTFRFSSMWVYEENKID
jgi:multiple sugar transport system permease protein